MAVHKVPEVQNGERPKPKAKAKDAVVEDVDDEESDEDAKGKFVRLARKKTVTIDESSTPKKKRIK